MNLIYTTTTTNNTIHTTTATTNPTHTTTNPIHTINTSTTTTNAIHTSTAPIRAATHPDSLAATPNQRGQQLHGIIRYASTCSRAVGSHSSSRLQRSG